MTYTRDNVTEEQRAGALALLHRAIANPGAHVPRQLTSGGEPAESLPAWGARAAVAALDRHPLLEIRPYHPTTSAYRAAANAAEKYRTEAEELRQRLRKIELATRDAVEFQCPTCACWGIWTDGRSISAGDEVDEYWCQACGAETSLAACARRSVVERLHAQMDDLLRHVEDGVREVLAADDRDEINLSEMSVPDATDAIMAGIRAELAEVTGRAQETRG